MAAIIGSWELKNGGFGTRFPGPDAVVMLPCALIFICVISGHLSQLPSLHPPLSGHCVYIVCPIQWHKVRNQVGEFCDYGEILLLIV